jgi:hypothetical protein
MVTKAKKRERRAQRNAAASTRVSEKFTKIAEARKHSTDLLSDESDMSSDLAMVNAAVVNQWPVQAAKAAVIVERLIGIVEKKTVTIPCGEGVFESESEADKNAMKASDLLFKMANSNNKKPSAGTTINVGVNVDASTDDRRNRTLAIAERFGASRVLSDSSGGSSADDSGTDRISGVVREIR